jgi:hypothetical protein
MGFLEVLTLIFIVLKLVGFLAWSWFWVLSPIILELVIGFVMICFFGGTSLFFFRWIKKNPDKF